MKVLDPQSALLSNVEVYQFLTGSPVRKQAKKVGAYPKTDLKGFESIKQDVKSYMQNVTPYVTTYGPVSNWMPGLISRLKPYGLTKTEVLNLVNLGVGLRQQPGDDPVNGEDEDEAMTENTSNGNDRLLLSLAVEEVDERFHGQDGDKKVEEIMTTIREAIQSSASTNGSKVPNV